MKKRNIALIGFMGAGKSIISKELGKQLGMKVISTDALIEEQQMRSIAEIFSQYGEEYFRNLEKNVVNEISAEENVVIDCGGGIVLNKENIFSLRGHSRLIYLSAAADTIYDRIKDKSHRPLLNADDPRGEIGRLLNERKSLYEQADCQVTTDDKTVPEIVEAIKAFFSN